jgi:hypothetical protein
MADADSGPLLADHPQSGLRPIPVPYHEQYSTVPPNGSLQLAPHLCWWPVRRAQEDQIAAIKQ